MERTARQETSRLQIVPWGIVTILALLLADARLEDGREFWAAVNGFTGLCGLFLAIMYWRDSR
jgi:hypothetical protein